jgi:hypothetical protein
VLKQKILQEELMSSPKIIKRRTKTIRTTKFGKIKIENK